jgi:hypothetical protein
LPVTSDLMISGQSVKKKKSATAAFYFVKPFERGSINTGSLILSVHH